MDRCVLQCILVECSDETRLRSGERCTACSYARTNCCCLITMRVYGLQPSEIEFLVEPKKIRRANAPTRLNTDKEFESLMSEALNGTSIMWNWSKDSLSSCICYVLLR